MRNEWKYDCDLALSLDPALPPVPCFETELNQVFYNLIINAIHSIQDEKKSGAYEKGKITISTSHDKTHAIVRIEDNGTGVPENIRDRIFDPFFTTKEVGKGTGQGLAISHTIIVQKHSGMLYLDIEYTCGAAFVIKLPLEG